MYSNQLTLSYRFNLMTSDVHLKKIKMFKIAFKAPAAVAAAAAAAAVFTNVLS